MTSDVDPSAAGPRVPRTDHPDFHQIVLDHVPTPILVASADGVVWYANRAMIDVTGITEFVGTANIVDGIHPDDVADALATFSAVVAEGHPHLDSDRRWAPYEFRLVHPDGPSTPVTVTGAAGFSDPVLQGLIYHLQPVPREDLLRRVLTGLSEGVAPDVLLGLVTEMVALAPLDLEAAIVERRGDHVTVRAASGPLLGPALTSLAGTAGIGRGLEWLDASRVPTFVAVADLAEPARSALADAGFVDLWVTGLHPGGEESGHRLLAATTYHRAPAGATHQRLETCRDVAEVVLTRLRLDDELRRAATIDALTGLANRARFFDHLDRAAVNQAGGTIGVLYVDLDEFKEVNDRAGHTVGDRLLATCAERLRAVVGPDDLPARVGGDEFAVIVPAATVGHLQRLADQIVDTLSAPFDVDGVGVRIGASVGGVVASADHPSDALIEQADHAMYAAKRAGGNRAVIIG